MNIFMMDQKRQSLYLRQEVGLLSYQQGLADGQTVKAKSVRITIFHDRMQRIR